MSGLKKVIVIFVVAIVLATVSNLFVNGVNATVEDPANQVNNTNTNDTNTNVANNTTNNSTNNTNTANNTNTNNTTENNTVENNTVENKSMWDGVRNAMPGSDTSQKGGNLPKTGSNFVLKNTCATIAGIGVIALGIVFFYNKKVRMTDENR